MSCSPARANVLSRDLADVADDIQNSTDCAPGCASLMEHFYAECHPRISTDPTLDPTMLPNVQNFVGVCQGMSHRRALSTFGNSTALERLRFAPDLYGKPAKRTNMDFP